MQLSPLVLKILNDEPLYEKEAPPEPKPKPKRQYKPKQPGEPRKYYQSKNYLKNNANSRKKRLAERELIDGKLIHPKAPHGKFTGYNTYGCQCDPCRKAYNAYVRERKKANARNLAR